MLTKPLHRRAGPLVAAAICTALLAPSGTASGQCAKDKLFASNGMENHKFGAPIALSGDAALIGADNGFPGTAYVFRAIDGAWTEEAKLRASDGFGVDRFARSLDLHLDVAVVGAYKHRHGGIESGAAYVYRTGTGEWTEEAELIPSDAQDGDRFGWAVAATDDTIFVGAPYDDEEGTKAGSVYEFRYQNAVWVEHRRIIPADAASFNEFGNSLCVAADRLLIGSPGPSYRGYVYSFRLVDGEWVEEDRFTAFDADPSDEFGETLAVDGNRLVAGAPSKDQTGAAYAFRWNANINGWEEEDQLAGPAGSEGRFGTAVAIDGDLILVGSRFGDGGATDTGAVYLFRRTGSSWNHETTLAAPDGQTGERFGEGLATDGRAVLVGATYENELGTRGGAVYVFDLACSVRRPASFQTIYGAYQSGTSSEIVVVFEAGTDAIPGRPPQKLRLFDFDAGTWEIIDERLATLTDSVVEITLDENPSRFIRGGDQAMRLRAEWFDPGNVIRPSWIVRIDQTLWEVTP